MLIEEEVAYGVWLADARQGLSSANPYTRLDAQLECEIDDELLRLRGVETAAQTLATAADALLDVTVAATPNTRLSSVAKEIGALNRAWKAWQKLTDPTWPKAAVGTTEEASRDA